MAKHEYQKQKWRARKKFGEHYENLFANPIRDSAVAQAWHDKMPQREQDRSWMPPTATELGKAIKEIKNAAPGLSGIPASMWKILHGNSVLQTRVLKVMQQCWADGVVPKCWRTHYLAVLPKKGDLTLPSNYRGISIGESLSKVHATIIKHRLNDFYETVVPEYSCGFRRGRGRADCIFSAKEVLRKRKMMGLESHGIFFDVQIHVLRKRKMMGLKSLGHSSGSPCGKWGCHPG
jgi:hypothetical protein